MDIDGLQLTPTRIIVSIFGPAGSGKSQLAVALVGQLGADRCARIPADYFLASVGEAAAAPLQYDWRQLDAILAILDGVETTTPDFDFERLKRRGSAGGKAFVLRPVMVSDAMEPYPGSHFRVLVTAPAATRRERVMTRDHTWKTRVIDRWEQLEATWARVQSQSPSIGMTVDGTEPLAVNAALIANWLREQGILPASQS